MRLFAGLVLMLAAALVQVTWASQLEIAGAFPNVVLIAVVALTWIQGVRAGLVWACAGGIFLDLNAPGPLGPHALALLLGAYVTGYWAPNVDGKSLLQPAGAVAMSTALYSLVLIAADGALGLPSPPLRTSQQLIIAASLYNAILTPLAISALRRVSGGLHRERAAT